MVAQRVQWSESVRERLAKILAAGCRNKWRCKQWRGGTCVGCAVGCIRGENAYRKCVDRCIEIAKAASDAGASGRAQKLPDPTARRGLRRPGKTDAWREAQFANRSQRIGNTRIPRIEDARR